MISHQPLQSGVLRWLRPRQNPRNIGWSDLAAEGQRINRGATIIIGLQSSDLRSANTPLRSARARKWIGIGTLGNNSVGFMIVHAQRCQLVVPSPIQVRRLLFGQAIFDSFGEGRCRASPLPFLGQLFVGSDRDYRPTNSRPAKLEPCQCIPERRVGESWQSDAGTSCGWQSCRVLLTQQQIATHEDEK